MRKLIFTPIALSLAFIMTGCVATSGSSTNKSTTNADGNNAQHTLARAIASQLRDSFSYQTHIYPANDIRRQALAVASNEQRTTYDDKTNACESRHDEDYTRLLAQIKNDGLDIKDPKYHSVRQTLKNDFQNCLRERDGGLAYEPFDFDEFYGHIQDLQNGDKAQAFGERLHTHMQIQSTANIKSEDRLSYDDNHTDPDAKKAELLQAYLLDPINISVTGRYEPFKRRISALPMIDYRAKNLRMMINQPAYIDLKAGGVYLWADNFALANSQFVDKQLGSQWRNKWLFIPFNDGSLPNGFSDDFIKAIIDAKKESYWAMSATSVKRISTKDIMALPYLNKNLPTDSLALIANTPTIIQLSPTEQERQYGSYVFADKLFNTMTAKYPMLTFSPEEVMFYEREINDGESVIAVVNINDDKPEDVKPTMNSQLLMRMLFTRLQLKVQNYYTQLSSSTHDDATSEPNPYQSITHYGLQGNKILWLHHRRYLTDEPKVHDAGMISTSEPMYIDSFTQIHQNTKSVGELTRLPATYREPNATNSINVFEYKDEFIERLKNSDDKYLQMMLTLLIGHDDDIDEVQYQETPKPDEIDEPSTE